MLGLSGQRYNCTAELHLCDGPVTHTHREREREGEGIRVCVAEGLGGKGRGREREKESSFKGQGSWENFWATVADTPQEGG